MRTSVNDGNGLCVDCGDAYVCIHLSSHWTINVKHVL